MKKLLMILAIVGVALVLLLWKNVTLNQRSENSAADTNGPGAIQSTNFRPGANGNRPNAPTQPGGRSPQATPTSLPKVGASAMVPEEAADLRYRDPIVALDVRDGINQEVREKERQMRKVAGTFRVGMPMSQILELLGEPSVIQTNITSNPLSTEESARGIRHKLQVNGYDFYFSSREGLEGSDRNGWGHQDLFLHLDGKGQLMFGQWRRPRVFMSPDHIWYKHR